MSSPALDVSQLTTDQLQAMTARRRWLETARPDQLPPADRDFLNWMLLAGRGSGKTRAGAEDVWWDCFRSPLRVAVIGPTNSDVRKTCFEGESGLLSVMPGSLIKSYNRTSLEMWLTNGSYLVGYSSEEPERLRGPQHHLAWCEELGAWSKPQDTWDMMKFGLRLGSRPRTIITTTPRPTPLMRTLVDDPETIVARASTYDNSSNLPESFIADLRKKYEGTRLGEQELHAKLLLDTPGALWTTEMIQAARQGTPVPPMTRIVVAVDPSGTRGDSGDEVGIVAAGVDDLGGYHVLCDASVRGSPDVWARAAVRTYNSLRADRIVAERNFGGAMVESVLRSVDNSIPYTEVSASRGKAVRAEPVAALYEQGRVRHHGDLAKLEEQMCAMAPSGYSGDGSPDRMDALVWALSFLMGRPGYSMSDLRRAL